MLPEQKALKNAEIRGAMDACCGHSVLSLDHFLTHSFDWMEGPGAILSQGLTILRAQFLQAWGSEGQSADATCESAQSRKTSTKK